ncbi:MAG: hypothetical protein BMS9Abin34_455 [Patescibacteria group bacterium]|nr:MAG: hypothetical protein BMS9Abin34_455 [Patescibacteria group bacterium]
MNLNELRGTILNNKKKIVFTFLFFISVIAGAVLLFPSQPTTSSPPPVGEGGEKTLPAFAFRGDTWSITGEVNLSKLKEASFPKSAIVYQAERQDISFSEAQAKEMAPRFGFEEDLRNRLSLPKGGIMYVFAKENENLTVISRPREIRYAVKNFPYTVGGLKGSLESKTAGAAKAREFMQNKQLPAANLTLYGVRYFTYQGEAVIETGDPQRANVLEVSFVQAVQGQELLGTSLTEPAARMIFNRRGEVVSFSYKFTDQAFTQYKEVKLLNAGEASNLLRKQGLVISTLPTTGLKEGLFESGNLTSFTPKKMRIALYPSEGTELFYPVYLFEGEGQVSKKKVNAVVILPAISLP